MRTVAFCEIDPYARAVLAKHWPDVPCYEDVRELTALRLVDDGIGAIDVVCGGFPCQPFSSAARGRNRRDHDTTLWLDMLRLVDETGPAWVVCENVANFDRLALEDVVSYLEGTGYEVATFVIPACAVGLDHRRNRFWIVGHAHRDRQPGVPVDAEMARLSQRRSDAGSMGATTRIPGRMDRLRLLGNSIVPAIAEIIGRAIVSAEAP